MAETKYYQIVPFASICSTASYNFFKQVVCNVLLFIPLPMFIRIMKKNIKGYKIILRGIMCSCLVEAVQLLLNIIFKCQSHVCDIDDVILNSVGVLIGYMIITVLLKVSFTKKVIGNIVYEK